MTDMVNRPAHYCEGRKYEPLNVISDWDLNYRLGSALKYISRAGRKDPSKTVEDLEKAIFYLNREVEALKSSQAPHSVTYEDVLEDHAACAAKGEELVLEHGVQDVDDQPLSHWEAEDSEWTAFWDKAFDTWKNSDSWDSDGDCMWDPSLGPVELSDKEVQDILDRKDLAQFDDNEIVGNVVRIDKRGFVIGVKADGTTHILRNRGQRVDNLLGL